MIQRRQKAPRHFDKRVVPLDLHDAVCRLGLSVPKTAALLSISTGSVEELKNIGGALKSSVIEHVRARLAALEAKSA